MTRGRYVLVIGEGPSKRYFAGFGRYATDRGAAVIFTTPPKKLVPGVRAELA